MDKKFILVAAAALLANSSFAQHCHRSTTTKLAMVDMPQSDRDLLCASVGVLGNSNEDSYTPRDFANMASAAQLLRRGGYKSQMMYLELVALAGIRPSTELSLVTNAFDKSAGCLTPAVLFGDISNAFKADRSALKMFQGLNKEGFTNYIVMVGADNKCSFR